ncbi:hypothetical protein ES703_89719 [subsurface metagenome]
MRKKILTTLLVLVVILSLASCVGEPSAQEIVDGVFEPPDNISTYQFDMDMTIDATGEAEDEAIEISIVMGINGALNLENRQMKANIAMDMAMTGEDEIGVKMALYLIDDMLYMMTEVPEMGPIWMKSEVSEGDWEEMSAGVKFTESQMELLESAEVTVLASEKIRGIDCYVLQLTPDMEQLWQTVMEQARVAGEEILPEVEETFLEEVFRNYSVKQWIAKDTYLLTKAEIAITMELTPEAMGYPEEEGEMTMDINMSLLVYDYNQSISIILPPEAEEAVEVPTFESSTEGELEAAETELANIQAATHALMVDNELSELPNPVTVATNDMSAFPDTSVCGADKINDWDGNAYQSGDKDGYILYQHDIDADNTQNNLVNYVATQYTTYWYYVDAAGTVTQVPTSAPETAPDVVQEKVKDIESIMGRAEGLGIHVEAVAHEGEIMTITCQAGEYTIFRNYVTALEESGRFSMVTPPSEKFSYITGGTIELEPKYQYIDMPAVYYEVNLALAPMTASDATAILVGIAEGSGIDIDPSVGKLRIAPATIRQVKAAGNTYQVLSFRSIQLQGDYEDVMAFISDLDSRKTLRTMILTRVVIIQIEAYGKIETAATVDVDIYTIES